MKINYTSPDGSRTQMDLDEKLIELWATANQCAGDARTVAEEVVPRAMKEQSAELTRTRRVERQLIQDTHEALRMDWRLSDPFLEFCRHYQLDPLSEDAKAQYDEYQRQQQLFSEVVG